MMSDGSIRVRRRQDVLYRLVADEALLARAGYDEIALLNGPAAVAWELLSEPQGFSELVTLLADVYGVAPESISDDVLRLVAELKERGWLLRDDD